MWPVANGSGRANEATLRRVWLLLRRVTGDNQPAISARYPLNGVENEYHR